MTYDRLAQRVAGGHGFAFEEPYWPATAAGEPTAHWSFLYTGLLAALYRVAGHAPLAARVLQAVAAGVLFPVLTWALARRALGEGPALWAAGVSAVYVYFVYYSATLMTETLTIAACLALLVVAFDLADRPSTRRWIAFGLLVGAAALLRQVTLAVVPFLVLWVLWRRRDRASIAGALLAAAVAVAFVLPVTVRNYAVFGRLVPANTNAGYAFFWANHPVHGRDFQGILSEEDPTYQELIPFELRSLDEAALNDALMARGWAFVREDPVRYTALSLSRLEDYFLFWPKSSSSTVSNLSRLLSFGLWLPFMLAGLWWSRDRWRACVPCLLFILVYSGVHLLSWALVRYRLPVDAVLVVFAGFALWRVVPALREHAAGRLAPVGA